jgi:hypothetical protein
MTDETEPVAAEHPDGGAQLPVVLDADARHLATPEDVAAFNEQFLRLLERRTAIYTMGDSTSVPRHVAADILRSVCFVLGIDPDDPTIPERLLRVDLEDEFRRGLAEIERKIARAQQLWQDVIATMPHIANIALRDTLVEIGEFPNRYDFRSMAHEIPVSIDYPLCHLVPEELLGVDYITEYLRRLLLEADFLRCFELDACVRVLDLASPDYVDLLVNLYEPIATNAIGLALIGKDPRPLRIAEEDRAEIAGRLGPLGRAGRERALREAATAVCRALGIRDEGAEEYLRAIVPELLPRFEVGLERGQLRGVFVD